MMYPRGGPPDTPKCPECSGSGKRFDLIANTTHECVGCNGTGIAGNPQAAFLILILVVIFWAIIFAFFFGG